jgi:signal transduction histidine kinase
MTRNQNPTPPSAQTSSSTTLRFVSLSLVFMAILALAAVAYFTERGIAVNRDWVIHTYQVRSQLNDLQLEIIRAQTNEAGFLLTGDRKQIPQSREQSHLASQTLTELRGLTKDNPRQQQRLSQVGDLLKENISLIESQPGSGGIPVQLSSSERNRQEETSRRDTQIDSIVRGIEDDEELLLEQRLRAWDYLFKRNVLMLGLAFAVVTVMLAYNFRVLVAEVARTKDTEKRVRDKAESYRLMSARILESQDSERRRIARELHDSVGQYLAGLKINLNQLETGVQIAAPNLIRETIELTDCAIQEVRTISHLLHPPLLEELGFLSAARWYLDEYGKRSQVKVSLLVEEPVERLPKEVEIALFRVLQEALTNVYRHAAAQSVAVRILCRDGHVTLTVTDDGKGIPQEILARFRGGAAPGIGLAGMRERLAEFGGHINVESSGGGSVLVAEIPTNGCAVDKPPVPSTGAWNRKCIVI